MQLHRYVVLYAVLMHQSFVSCDSTDEYPTVQTSNADMEAMNEIKEIQQQADLETIQQAILEEADAQIARLLEHEEEGMPVGRRTEPLPTVEDKQPIPTPGPGLRYRKTPIEDDILSSRRGSRMPPGYPGPSAARVEQSADETASSGPSPQAAELRMRVASNESDRLKRIKLDYALQWQKDHSTSPEPRSQEEINSAQPNDSPVAKAEKYINPMQHESEDTIIEGSDAYFFERFRVSRHWSRPVENILKYAAHERRGRRSTATLYDILGISSSSSIAEIKKSFRQRSLLVHPDKNPHPDAQTAFDLLSSAYDVLSDEQSKEIYDERLILSSSIHNPYKLTNIKRGVYIFFDNFTSRVLLFFARIRRGQWIEELEDLTEIIRSHRVWNTKRNARLLVKKFVLLPSWFDRMVLLGEYFWMLKFEAMFAIFSILALSSLPSMNGGDTYYYDNI